MNLRQIEVFRSIVLCRSITEAARILNVSQPTITKVLRHAEDQLGYKLFRREHGRLQPTEEARLLFPDADRIFRELQSLQRLSTDLREGTGGLLRVGATASLALSVVPDALERYRRQFPGVRVMSHLLAGNEMAEMIMAHQLDIGVSIAPIDAPSARIETVHKTEMICIAPRDHPLAALPVITPSDIAGHTLISYSGATPVGLMLEDAFRRAGIRRTGRYRSVAVADRLRARSTGHRRSPGRRLYPAVVPPGNRLPEVQAANRSAGKSNHSTYPVAVCHQVRYLSAA